MSFRAVTLSIAVLSACGPEPLEPRPSKPSDSACLGIVNGWEAPQPEWDAVVPVLILERGRITASFCSGTWIGADAVLTARHCLLGRSVDDIAVAFATRIDLPPLINRPIAQLGAPYALAQAFVVTARATGAGPRITPSTASSDIAIVKVTTARKHRSIPLSTAAVAMGQRITLAGFGGGLVRRLGTHRVDAVNFQGGANVVLAGALSFAGSEGQSLTEPGDSGGPIISDGAVVGVISAGSTAPEILRDFPSAEGVSLIAPTATSILADMVRDARARGFSLEEQNPLKPQTTCANVAISP